MIKKIKIRPVFVTVNNVVFYVLCHHIGVMIYFHHPFCSMCLDLQSENYCMVKNNILLWDFTHTCNCIRICVLRYLVIDMDAEIRGMVEFFPSIICCQIWQAEYLLSSCFLYNFDLSYAFLSLFVIKTLCTPTLTLLHLQFLMHICKRLRLRYSLMLLVSTILICRLVHRRRRQALLLLSALYRNWKSKMRFFEATCTRYASALLV